MEIPDRVKKVSYGGVDEAGGGCDSSGDVPVGQVTRTRTSDAQADAG